LNTYFYAWIGSVVVALVAAPLVIRLARRIGALDTPGVRKVHFVPTPAIGGAVIVPATLIVTALVVLLGKEVASAFAQMQTRVLVLSAAALGMFLLGLVDDVRGLQARTKFLIQIMAALAVSLAGLRIERLPLSSWCTVEFGMLSWPLTVLWIVGITNAINLIDGLDGLAAGISAIAAGTIAVFAIVHGHVFTAAMMLCLLGSLTGFLFYNFYPARLFLGNCGTYFLGFVLGSGGVLCCSGRSALVGLSLTILVLGVPIMDTLMSMLRRCLQRRSLFAPDRSHIHHRLLKMGMHQTHAVVVLYAVTLVAAVLAMLMMSTSPAWAIVIFTSVLVQLILLFHMVGAVRLREVLRAFRRRMSIARQQKEEKQMFEQAHLCLREANSFREWWLAVCDAAEEFGFRRLALRLPSREGGNQFLAWRRSRPMEGSTGTLRFTMPVGCRNGPTIQARAEVHVNGSVEAAGRRVALFSRLIEEHNLPGFPPAGVQTKVQGFSLSVEDSEAPESSEHV
jgi:UDP-GlcNAc:undecaprenyl-phosphate GlcNAc-1-phosphate transferase